jgi:dCTP deaminase
MILTDQEILKNIEEGKIVIRPFDPKALGSNSYDVHLGRWFATYDDEVLDSKKHNQISSFEIGEEGHVLMPDKFYLASTLEYTETHSHIPFLEGKSSSGRLGIDIHATAGKGDIGFCNHWTLEISVKKPVRVYPGMPIGQIIYFESKGACTNNYQDKHNAKYNRVTDRPVESMMWKNF